VVILKWHNFNVKQIFIIHKRVLSIDWINQVNYGIRINYVDFLLFFWINILYLQWTVINQLIIVDHLKLIINWL
jgi:hypothetical protein